MAAPKIWTRMPRGKKAKDASRSSRGRCARRADRVDPDRAAQYVDNHLLNQVQVRRRPALYRIARLTLMSSLVPRVQPVQPQRMHSRVESQGPER